MSLTAREKAITKEWYDFTGWEFLGPDEGETFLDALRRNRRWLENHTTESLRIGEDYEAWNTRTGEANAE